MAIDTSYAVADGSPSAPSLTFNAKPTTGVYRDGTGNVCVAVAGVTVAKFTASGLQGGVAAAVNIAAPAQTLTPAQAGQSFIAAGNATAFVLPTALLAGQGAKYTFICGVAGGTGLTVTRAGADTINAKTLSAGGTAITGATVVTNTGGSSVVWDRITLVSDDVSKWYEIAHSGIWA